MGTLLTNASAKTAIRQLNAVARQGDRVRSEISTGLKVQSAQDNAAFFVVSAKTKGDVAVISGIKENLTMTKGAILAAQTAGASLTRIIDNLTDIVGSAQSGIAIKELEVTYQELIGQARDIIDAAGFNGVNLLATDDTNVSVIGLDRSGGDYQLQTLSVSGGDFKRKAFNNAVIESATEFVLGAGNFQGKQAVGSDDWTPSVANPGFLVWEDLPGPDKIYQNAADVQANSPRLDYRVQITNPGRYYVFVRGIGYGGNADSIHVGFDGTVLSGTGGVAIPSAGGNPRWGYRDTHSGNQVFVDIASPGLYTINLWGREDGTAVEGIVFTQDPSTAPFTGSAPLPAISAIAGNSDLPFFSDLIDGEVRRNTAGFMELLSAVTPTASRFAPQAALQVLDAARSKLNRYMSQLGAYEKVLDRQETYLATVAGGLSEGVADLIETDLEEASSRLAAIQVQESLAVQGLQITNGRTSLVLSLFG
ncbi:MAG: flagellin [Parvularcula sp.]|nr:flagellin [Parvularcula sp.]